MKNNKLNKNKKNDILKQEAKKLSRLALYFTILSILFIILSPIFLGPIFTLVFIVPIYIALNGVKKKRKSGLYVALGMVPLSLGVSINWIMYDIVLYKNFSKEFELIKKANQNISEVTIKIISIAAFILSIITIIIAIVTFVQFIRNKKLFNR